MNANLTTDRLESDGIPVVPRVELDTPQKGSGRVSRLEPAVRAIQEHPEADWTLESLSEAARMSRSVFAERFLATVGVTPGRFLLECRMKRASELLRNRDLVIKEIAAKVGYGSESSFGNAFKRWSGRPPGACRSSMLS